jgi:uncharacterized membrane-anchored protein
MNGETALNFPPELIQEDFKSFNYPRSKHNNPKWMITDNGSVLCVNLHSRHFIVNGIEKFEHVDAGLYGLVAPGIFGKTKNIAD